MPVVLKSILIDNTNICIVHIVYHCTTQHLLKRLSIYDISEKIQHRPVTSLWSIYSSVLGFSCYSNFPLETANQKFTCPHTKFTFPE